MALQARVMFIAASSSSWLAHSAWLVPLGTIVAAAAAVLTAAIAAFIGWQAKDVANAQKEIAGLAEITKMSETLVRPEYVVARRRVAIDYLVDAPVDEESAYDLLDFTEDLALFERNGYIHIDDLATLHSFKIICWWYASKPVVAPFRKKRDDPLIWKGTEELIAKIHKACRKDSPKWGVEPTRHMMCLFFEDELALTASNSRPTLQYSGSSS